MVQVHVYHVLLSLTLNYEEIWNYNAKEYHYCLSEINLEITSQFADTFALFLFVTFCI